MPRSSKHGRRAADRYFSEVTVHDYADAKSTKITNCVRIKKAAVSTFKTQAKSWGESCRTEMEELAWYDKDLDDFDVAFQHENTELEDQHRQGGESTAVLKKQRKKTSESGFGIIYPIDVWFHLSSYIHPEMIGIFAGICRGSSAIVRSVRFWKQQYIRHYRSDCEIPDSLQRDHLECIHGLRARVIQALFYMYPPLADRTKTTIPFQNEPHGLVGQRCLLTWHMKVKNVWKFYFKFKKGDDSNETDTNIQRGLKSRLFPQWHRDLYYNPENGCIVMEVTCSSFMSLPIVMGQILNKLYLNVSSGMRYHRLRLMFDTSFKATSSRSQNEMLEVVMDPVLELRIYPWWLPKYQECMRVC